MSSAHRPPGRGAGGGTRRPARPDRSPRRPRPRRWTAAGTRRARPTTPTPTPELRPLRPPRPHRPRPTHRHPRPSPHRASSPRVGLISPPQPPRAPPPRAPSPAPPSTPPSPRLPSFRPPPGRAMKPRPRPLPASASHPPRHPPRTRRRGPCTAPRTSRSRVWRVPSPTTKACRPRGTPRCPPPDRHLCRSRRRRLSCHHPLHRRPSRRARAWRR